jgi:Ca-activated chloride channel family protein
MGNELAIMKTLAGEKMPLLGVTAQGILSGELFELEVEQRYRNDDDKNIEAIYTFPLAPRAVLLGIEFELNGNTLTGTAMEKRHAERKYEKAIDKGNTAILLEKTSEGLYTVNLGNLMAGEEAVVRYRYAEPLVWERGQLRLVIPNAIAPRYGNPEAAGMLPHQIPETDLGVGYPFTLSIDVLGDLAKGNITSPSHALSVAVIEGGVRLNLNKGWLDRDFILTMSGTGKSKVSIVQDDNEWLAMATFCPTMPDSDSHLPVSLRLVIDCSGSMAGDSITQARQAAIKVIESLRPGDEFDVTLFGSQHRHLFDRLMKTDGLVHVTQAIQALIGLEADMGGTEMGKALHAAASLKAEQEGGVVLLITDGEIWNMKALIETAHKSHQRYFVVGVGSSPSHVPLRRLADETGGAYEAVSPNEDIVSAVLRQFARMRQPHAYDLAMEWPVPPIWITPLPKTLFQNGMVHVYAGFSQFPAGNIKLTYTTGNRNKQEECAILSTQAGDPRSLIRIAVAERIMAIDKATDGERGIALSGMPDFSRNKKSNLPLIPKLAVKYNLVTAYTNYLIVHKRAEGEKAENLPEIRQVKQMLAAGWGGSGSVAMARPMPMQIIRTGCDDAPIMESSFEETPSVMTSRRERTIQAMDDSGIDMPAFLKKQPGDNDKETSKLEHFHLKDLLKKLIMFVNGGLVHPDGFPTLVKKLNNVPELNPLQDFIKTINSHGIQTDEIWVAFISWAAQQLGSECQLTRHAARSIQSLTGAIAPDRLARLMAKFDEKVATMVEQHGN